MTDQTLRNSSYAAWIWIVQIVTGFLVLILVTIHMIAHHFIVEGGLRDFQQVLAYLSNPFVVVLEIMFLITVTTHALIGIRAIILDLGPSRRLEVLINRGLIIAGVIIVVYGVWLLTTLLATNASIAYINY